MKKIVKMNQDKYDRYEEINKRLSELDDLFGMKKDERGMSLHKASFTNEFAAKRVNQLRAQHPFEWDEYLRLIDESVALDEELGISDQVLQMLDELYPEEKADPNIIDLSDRYLI